MWNLQIQAYIVCFVYDEPTWHMPTQYPEADKPI